MKQKDLAIEIIQELPEEATWEDIQDRINFVAGVRKGRNELDSGQGINHETIKNEWSSLWKN